MNQSPGDLADSNRNSKLRYFWEDHKLTVVLLSCLVLPFIFIPVWILVFLVVRIRSAFGRSSQDLPRDKPTNAAVVPEQGSGKPRTRMEKVDEVVSYVGVFFNGFIAVVGVMLCVLGSEVSGLASGQPGGGIALLMGYCLVAGGVIAIIVGLVGVARGASRKAG